MTSGRAAAETTVRFDKWLWAARFYKTRSLAAQAAETGQARVNGNPVKPAHAVRVGDSVTVRKHGIVAGCRGADDFGSARLRDRRRRALSRNDGKRHGTRRGAGRAGGPPRRRNHASARRPTKRERRKLTDFLNEP